MSATEPREDLSDTTYKPRLHRRRMAELAAWWAANGYTTPLEPPPVDRGDAWEGDNGR